MYEGQITTAKELTADEILWEDVEENIQEAYE